MTIDIEPKPFWSNCLIEAIKVKFKDWSGVKLIPIWHGLVHFHMMWLDKRISKIFHFTHKSLPGWHCDLFFKGRIEEVDQDGLKKWLKNNKAIAPDLE